jgi:hypothetical protein
MTSSIERITYGKKNTFIALACLKTKLPASEIKKLMQSDQGVSIKLKKLIWKDGKLLVVF